MEKIKYRPLMIPEVKIDRRNGRRLCRKTCKLFYGCPMKTRATQNWQVNEGHPGPRCPWYRKEEKDV